MTSILPPRATRVYRLRDLRESPGETFVGVEQMSLANRREWKRRQRAFEAEVRAEVDADPELQRGAPEQPERRRKHGATRERILAVLRREARPVRTGELAGLCGIGAPAVSEHCYQLVRQGLVRKVGVGIWESTECAS